MLTKYILYGKVPTKYTSENKDLILALKLLGIESRASRVNVDGSPEEVVPIMTSTDVKLLYAECEIHLGNNAKASKYISEVGNIMVFPEQMFQLRELSN